MPRLCNCSVSSELTLPFTAIKKISNVLRSVYREVYPEGDMIIFGGVPRDSPSEFASAEPPCTKTSCFPCFRSSAASLHIAEKSAPCVPPSFTTVIDSVIILHIIWWSSSSECSLRNVSRPHLISLHLSLIDG